MKLNCYLQLKYGTDNSQADSFGFIQTMPMSSNIPSGTMAWCMSFSNRDHSCCQPFLWPY